MVDALRGLRSSEPLHAAYPDWEVRREARADRPEAWVARRGPVSLSAPSAAHLLSRLEEHELSRLQAEYGGTYRVWRAGQWWMGTAIVDGITPTLMEATAGALEARLRDPGPQYGAPFPREAT